MSIKGFLTASALLCTAVLSAATYYDDDYVVTGSYSIGKTTTVQLNSEGYWCAKVSPKAGSPYTFVVTGEGVDIELGYGYKEDGEIYWTTFGSVSDDIYSSVTRLHIFREDWEDESIVKGEDWDPEFDELVKPTGYYLLVRGEEGQTVTVTSSASIQYEPIPKGMPGNEDAMTVAAKGSDKTVTLTETHEGDYYVSVKLTAGTKYFFTTDVSNGTELSISNEKPAWDDPAEQDPGTGNDTGTGDEDGEEEELELSSLDYVDSTLEDGLCVVPLRTGTYYIDVRNSVFTNNNGSTLSVKLHAWSTAHATEQPVILTPVLGTDETGSEVQTLTTEDWYNIYQIDARKGVKYSVRLVAEEPDANRVFPTRIYTKSGSAEKDVETTDLARGYELDVKANQTYYLMVLTAAAAEDFAGTYKLYVDVPGEGYGILKLDLMGPAASQNATWSIDKDSSPVPKYGDGSALIVSNGQYTVKFAAVQGWSTPTNRTYTVVAGETTADQIKYNDTSDTKDDQPAGAVSITPTRLAVAEDGSYTGGLELARSLWESDPADWFKFTVAKDDEFWYSLKLAGRGDLSKLTAEVYLAQGSSYAESTATKIEMNGANGLTKLQKGTYFVKVSGAEYDAPYAMTLGFADFGSVAFDKKDTLAGGVVTKPAYSFAENAQYAVVKVNRPSGVSALKVRFTTRAQTALPGIDYKPVTTVLEWKDGDKAAKTVNIPLIPDLYSTYEGAAKTFAVELSHDLLDGAESEYPVIPLATATVELKEVSKIVPGTIAFASYENAANDPVVFANPKKPDVKAVSGSELVLRLERQTGANGAVGVKVETAKGTALADQDFKPFSGEILWADGDLAAKQVRIELPTTAPAADKTFTVKMTALAKDAEGHALQKATLAAATATVTLRHADVAQRLEEDTALSKTLKGTKGVWYFNEKGDLVSTALPAGKTETLTYTVTGPGRISFTPMFDGDAAAGDKVIATVGKETISCVNGEEIVRYLPKGNQTIKLSLTRGKTSANELSLTLANCSTDNGNSVFDWSPLNAVTQPVPADKAVVGLDTGLAWRDVSEDPNVSYNVYFGDNKSALTKAQPVKQLTCEAVSLSELGAVAGKTYFWRLDSVMCAAGSDDVKLVNTNTAIWQVSVAAEGVAGKPVLMTAAGETVNTDETVTLIQGVAVSNVFDQVDGVSYKLLSGKLPDGVKLVTDSKTKVTVLSGTPTKTGAFTAVIQASVGNKPGETVNVDFEVLPMLQGEGTFTGVLWADGGEESPEPHEEAALISFTATTAGKLSASVTMGGVKYAFSAAGYAVESEDDRLTARMVSTVKAGSTVYTNELEVVVPRNADVPADDTLAVLSEPVEVTLRLKGYDFAGCAYRSNVKDSTWLAAAKAAEGYYTVVLPVADADAEKCEPQGAGYLTLTVDAKGGVKIAGALGDGMAVSATATIVCRLDDTFGGGEFELPFYLAKGKEVCAGVLVLARTVVLQETGEETDTFVVDPLGSRFIWANGDPNATLAGEEGFILELHPEGGFYDKLFNLQTYYLNKNLKADLWEDGEEGLPLSFFGQYGAQFSGLLTSPDEMVLTLVGDTVTAAKKTLVKQQANNKLTDLEASENASNFTVKFTRATGLFNGTFSLWLGDSAAGSETVQKEVTGIKFAGVLTPYKAVDSEYQSCPALGHFLVPVKLTAPKSRTWTGSYLFRLQADDVSEQNAELWNGEGAW